MKRFRKFVDRLIRTERGSVSLELVLILPLLMFGLAVTAVAFDGFRSRNQTLVAAHTVSDLLSRETTMFTADYLEGMNDVFDFLADTRHPTRLRVSSIIWNSAEQRHALQWSYGTRGLMPLSDEMLRLLASGQMTNWTEALTDGLGDDSWDAYLNTVSASVLASQGTTMGGLQGLPETNLIARIPPVLPGEALILVESFALWTPVANVGVGQVRLSPVAVTRPRFSPWVNLEGAIPVFPEDDYEVAFTGYVPGVTDLPDPNDPPAPTPITDPVTVIQQNFTGGDATGWSQTPIGSNATIGNFLGPFGNETFANPVTRTITLPNGTARAQIAFDYVIIDSWDGFSTAHADPIIGDVLSLMINGQVISTEPFQHSGGFPFMQRDRTNTVTIGQTTWTINMTRTQHGTNFIGNTWTDQVWRVTLHAEAPPDTFTLGFSARLNSGISDEAFGITNFAVVAMPGTAQPVAFSPLAADIVGTHPGTRFPIYRGCPNPHIGAARLDLTQQDLGQEFDAPIANPGTAEQWRGQNGTVYTLTVTGRASGSGSGSIWGTDIYSDDSNIATAAVHAGVLAHGETGAVWLTVVPGQSNYVASSRNGVSSSGWGAWHGSYTLERATTGVSGSTLHLLRQASGTTHASQCPDVPGNAFFNASATYALHWNNGGLSGPGNRLRIRTNDNNNGRSCDTALLIRDPSGQYFFNDDISGSDFNARLNLGNAQTGLYHIFLGTFAGNTCNANLVFMRY
jgi:hypothetical protein